VFSVYTCCYKIILIQTPP